MSKLSNIRIKDKEFELFIREEKIQSAIQQVASNINIDFADKKPLFVCVLNGAFMFASDLLKNVNIPCEITFVRLKSYQGTTTEGKIKEIYGFVENFNDRNIVLVEDIVDTGNTIAYLIQQIEKEKPKSIKTVTLLFKPGALLSNIKPDYAAIEIPNDFIIGYGLDYDGEGRNLRNIYKII